MPLAAVPAWVTDVAVVLGALLTFTTFIGVVSRSRPGRWLLRQVGEDVQGWIQRLATVAAQEAIQRDRAELDARVDERLEEMLPRHLGPILHELRANGGGSFRDQVIRRLNDLARRMDRFATFMDESSMDRRDLRALFEGEIARTKRAEHGEINDREEPET